MRIGFIGPVSIGDRYAVPPARSGGTARRPGDSADLPATARAFAAMPGHEVVPSAA